jgi:hypothetical protein
MNALETVAPLVALASPVLALVALNVYLALHGERGTLLLPSFGSRRPASELRAESLLPATFDGRQRRPAANDPDFRHAA